MMISSACITILHDDQFSTEKETAVSNFVFHRKIFHMTNHLSEKVPEQFSHLHELVSLLTHEHEFIGLQPYGLAGLGVAQQPHDS